MMISLILYRFSRRTTKRPSSKIIHPPQCEFIAGRNFCFSCVILGRSAWIGSIQVRPSTLVECHRNESDHPSIVCFDIFPWTHCRTSLWSGIFSLGVYSLQCAAYCSNFLDCRVYSVLAVLGVSRNCCRGRWSLCFSLVLSLNAYFSR
jgi:hypothetical protein